MLKYASVICIIIFCFACAPEPIESDLKERFGSLPEAPMAPSDNMMTPEKINLGKLLFWDPILSGNKDIACVSCHHPQHGWSENLDLSIGVGGTGLSAARKNGVLVNRNAPTVLNTAFNGINSEGIQNPELAPMFWDSRNSSLEEQAIQPLLSAEEMRGNNISESAILDTIIQRLNNIPQYVSLFEQAFGESQINEENIGKAIASFERTLIAPNSRFDKYVNGDEQALSSLELRGMINFIEVGCDNCHNGPMFSDFEMHVLTVPENEKLTTPDDGNGNFAFRTPSLRNLEFTAPYMHNGSFETLEQVLGFYDRLDDDSQNSNVPYESRDEKLKQLQFADDKTESIIAFIKSLSDQNFDVEIVDEVPSGLSPGGNID